MIFNNPEENKSKIMIASSSFKKYQTDEKYRNDCRIFLTFEHKP
jgi:hypothetical protein